MKKLWLLITMASLLAACASPAAPTSGPAPAATAAGEQRADQQILRVGTQGLAAELVPRDTAIAWYQFWAMYDSLTQLGPDYKVQPSIAEKWDLSPDGLTWTFTIRKGVKWPDGSELNANDVKFTIDTLIEKNSSLRSRIPAVTSAKALDDYRVELATRKVDVSIPNNGAVIWIFPKKVVDQVGWDAFIGKPVGSGPYELIEYRSADIMRFKKKATPHAFRKPVADEISIKAIPEASQLMAGLRTGELDLVPQANFAVEQVEQLKSGGFQVTAPLATSAYMVMMHGAALTRKTPLLDKRVRQAINYAIDRDTIAKQFYKEYAKPSGQQAVPGSLYYDSELGPWPYDVKKAKDLLAEAGYPTGFKLEVGIVFTPSRAPQDVILAVKQYLGNVGIDADVKQTEVGVWTDYAFGRNVPQPDFLATFSVESDGFYTNWRAVAGCDRGGSIDKAWTCNADWDKTFDSALTEADPAKRAAILKQASKIFREDSPVVLLVNGSQFFVSTNKVRALEIPTPQFYNLDSVYKVK